MSINDDLADSEYGDDFIEQEESFSDTTSEKYDSKAGKFDGTFRWFCYIYLCVCVCWPTLFFHLISQTELKFLIRYLFFVQN